MNLFVADLNGDHKLDVVTFPEESALIYLGNGDGTLKPYSTVSLPTLTENIAVGDVDGDGIPDIVALRNLGEVDILHGNGDGTFRLDSQTIPLPGAIPVYAIVADVNKDGKPDLIVVDFFGNAYIILGSGNGNFQKPVAYPVPGASSLAVGDFDGDGNLDLAVASEGANGSGTPPEYSSITLLLGSGDGTFTNFQTLQVPGILPYSLSVADFDGDGAADIALDGFGMVPEILYGSHSRQFSVSPIPGADLVSYVDAVDLDGDGFPDLGAFYPNGDILLGRGGRNFEKVYNLQGSSYLQMVGDMNGDGKPDLVALNGSAVSIFLNEMQAWNASVTAISAPAVYGEQVAFTANFTSTPTSFQTPTGAVTWMAGDTFLGNSALSGTANSMTSTLTTTLPAGSYAISVKCVGVSAANSSTLSVPKAAATITGTFTTSTASAVTLQASVAGYSPLLTPTGTVAVADSGKTLATVTLSGSGSAQAVFAESAGVHSLQLNYSGDANFLPSAITLSVLVTNPIMILSAADGVPVAAPQSIVSIYGTNLTTDTTQASGTPLQTMLGGTEVLFTDSTPRQLVGSLYLVSPGQINVVVPAVAPGTSNVQVSNFGFTQFSGTLTVLPSAPSLFTANGTGSGVAAATLLTVSQDGAQSSQNVFTCATAGECVPVPLDLSDPTKQYYLVLYGTGIGSASSASASVDGVAANVSYAGAQGQSPGLDQFNLQLPQSLSGKGTVNVSVTAGGQTSNVVTIGVQ